MVKFSGVLTEVNGKPLTGTVGVTFSLYKESESGTALWVETQNVAPDKSGHYSVALGSTSSQGLPGDLFVSGEARWLEVQAQGQAAQPRTLLTSVPYALKAADAQTLGGMPASAFVLAASPSGGSSAATATAGNAAADPGTVPPASGSGTTDFVPLWMDNNGTLGNSAIYQAGTAKKPKIGMVPPNQRRRWM